MNGVGAALWTLAMFTITAAQKHEKKQQRQTAAETQVPAEKPSKEVATNVTTGESLEIPDGTFIGSMVVTVIQTDGSTQVTTTAVKAADCNV